MHQYCVFHQEREHEMKKRQGAVKSQVRVSSIYGAHVKTKLEAN